MISLQSIIDRVKFITKDEDGERWTTDEMVIWAADAIDQIVTRHPRAASQYVVLNLESGARQDLRLIAPDVRWVRLHSIDCNCVNDEPVGASVRMIARSSLDYSRRNWRSMPLASEVKEYAMDEREPYTFDVYPPVESGTQVYALASIRPERVTDEGDEFPLADGFDIPVVDYILYRLFFKDASDPTYAARATAHLQAYQMALGIELQDAKAE